MTNNKNVTVKTKLVKHLYVIYDKLAKVYNDPIVVLNDDVAKRGFGDECQMTDSMLNKFPTDYTLFRIGDFDPYTGELTAYEPIVVCRALDYVRSE